jgi:hypothetical protein
MAVAALAGSLDERTIRALASATSRPSCVDAGGVPEPSSKRISMYG